MISRSNISLTAIAGLLLLGAPQLVGADGFVSLVGIPGVNTSDTPNFGEYVNQLYILSITLAALLAFVKLVLAGAKYMTSDVVSDKGSAKSDIQGALLGLLIIIGAVLILNEINPSLTNLNALQGSAVDFEFLQRERGRYDPPENSEELASRQASCLARGEDFRFIAKPGTWDNPIDAVDCCVPGSTGENACTITDTTTVAGVSFSEGQIFTNEEYEALIETLNEAGALQGAPLPAGSTDGIEDQRNICETKGGQGVVIKRQGSAPQPVNVVVCLKE